MQRKNQKVMIYFDKERICSLPFEKINITIDDGNYLYLEASNAEKGEGKREKGKDKKEKAPTDAEAVETTDNS